MIKKILLYSLTISAVSHYIFLHSDQIYYNFIMSLNEQEQKRITPFNKNIATVTNILNKENQERFSNLSKDDSKELLEYFKSEKMHELSKISQEKNINNKNKSEFSDKKPLSFSSPKQNFGNFAPTGAVSVNEGPIEPPSKFQIKIIKKSEITRIEKTKCDDFYFGIGLTLGYHYVVTGISPYSSIPSELNIKPGDLLLGFKSTDGVFYEGNTLVNLIQNSYKNEYLTIMLKQNNQIVTKQIQLNKICFSKQKNNI